MQSALTSPTPSIAVLDNAHDEVSSDLILKLDASEFFDIKYHLSSYDEIDPAFKKGQIKDVIIFPADFAERLTREGNATVSIIADGSEAEQR